LFKILLISKDVDKGRQFANELASRNIVAEPIVPDDTVEETIVDKAPDLIILALENSVHVTPIIKLIKELERERRIFILALIPADTVRTNRDIAFMVDDFTIEPYETEEIALRIKKALKETFTVDDGDMIRSGNLLIDLSRREVALEGKIISLTFTEYELLVFLATNSGRVFSRDALLNKIWGYDYYGGDRTVDVHIRRLRAKIEWGKHSFIETVRGIGYRFKEPT
jgi:two-component system alkaline phosphatase synthesis response regulator PhoP